MRDDRSDVRAVRQVYLVVLPIPLVLVAGLWIVQGVDDPFRRVTFAAVVAVHGLLVLGVANGRVSLRTAGPWVVLSPTAILISRLLLWEAWPSSRPDDFGLVIAALAWFGTLFALAFLVFGTRRGAVVSLCGYALVYLGAGWSAREGMLAESGSIGTVVFLAGGHAALIVVVWVLARNVEKLSAARTREELLRLEATTDALTGVANRRRLDDELQRLIARSRRSGRPLSVVLVDLDHFKVINDTWGHDAGDQVLVATVARLLAGVREADLLGRWGGEEFLLLAPDADHASARALAERCRSELVATPILSEGITVTASFGVATLAVDDDARALMRRADLALYAAKSDGRDRVVGVGDEPPLEATEHVAGTDGAHQQA
jgi:diguanylate cyclase (GGDEF)-like protein